MVAVPAAEPDPSVEVFNRKTRWCGEPRFRGDEEAPFLAIPFVNAVLCRGQQASEEDGDEAARVHGTGW